MRFGARIFSEYLCRYQAAAAALSFLFSLIAACCSIAYAQPFGLETEWGEVRSADGAVEKSDPAKPQQQPIDLSVPGLSKPSTIGINQSGIKRSNMKQFAPDPKPVVAKPEPEPVPVVIKPEPKPEPMKPKPVPPRAARRNLYRLSSFSLYGKIEYNYRSKKLRATNALCSISDFSIYADELSMDLHSANLSARGSVTLEFNRTQLRSIAAESILLDMNSLELKVTDASGNDSFYSISRMGSYEEYTNNQSSAEALLLPAAADPALSGISDISFPEADPRDIVTGTYMSASSGSGLSMYNVTYTFDDGRKEYAPYWKTRNGELFEETARETYLSVSHQPGTGYSYATLKYDYYFDNNPRGQGAFSGMNRREWNNGADEWNLSYSLSKSYIRGNDYASFSLSRYGTWFDTTAGLSHFVFDKFGGTLRTTLKNYVSNSYFRITKENSGESVYTLNSKKFFVFSGLAMSKGSSTEDDYYGVSPFNEEMSLKSVDYDIYLEKKPERIPRTSFRYSMSSELYKYSNWTEYNIRPASYNYSYKEFTFITSVFSKDYRLRRNIFASTRADWRFYSSSYMSYQYTSVYQDRSRSENADGNAQIRWMPSKRIAVGGEYIWARARNSGAGSWVPYISYSPRKKINLRLGAHFRQELAAYGYEYPKNIQGETLDLAWRAGRTDYLTASFDLDTQLNGATLFMLSYTGKRRFGDFSFSAYKHTDYYNSGLFSPYRYTMYFSFR